MDYEDLVKPSRAYAMEGRWSGTEGRHRKHYIAMVPVSRYRMPDDDEVRYDTKYLRVFKHGWDGAQQRKEVRMETNNDIVHQIFLAGQLVGIVMKGDNPRELKAIAKQIDPDVLQGFLDRKPEDFLYAEQVQQAIRLGRTFKSLSKG